MCFLDIVVLLEERNTSELVLLQENNLGGICS